MDNRDPKPARSGPLRNIRVVEFSGIGPGPFGAMLLSDMGADVEKTDACAQPVISLSEAPNHPHLSARGVYTKVGAFDQPAPAPRFSRTPSAIQGPPSVDPTSVNDVLEEWRAT